IQKYAAKRTVHDSHAPRYGRPPRHHCDHVVSLPTLAEMLPALCPRSAILLPSLLLWLRARALDALRSQIFGPPRIPQIPVLLGLLWGVSAVTRENHGTTGPQDHRTTGPQDHRTTGPQDHRTTGPQDHRSTEAQEHKRTEKQEKWKKGKKQNSRKSPYEKTRASAQEKKRATEHTNKGATPQCCIEAEM